MITEQKLRGTAKGSIGSLFVTVRVRGQENRSLPCVLSYWFKQFAYDDPLGGAELPRLKNWHDVMRDLQQVVVAQVEVTSAEGSRHMKFRRTGYVGVYTIRDFKLEKPHLRFVRAQRPILELQ